MESRKPMRSKRSNSALRFTEVRYKPLNAAVKSAEDSSDEDEGSVRQNGELVPGSSPSSVDPKSTCPLKRYYIGIVTRKTSEMFVWRNTAFRVYHEMTKGDSTDNELPLYIVYKNSRGQYFIYASLHSYSQNSGLTADVFPWWLQMDAGKDD
ncbi:hypothetical protein Tcan_15611 [Toxocara canis]|uniref:Uncharacterized protein n=1 Tax=Toxocara canis TaxID=6265 RepID=A0A0B2VBW7_TOXCA|nr:hypothetical protein Tcan_15611 [Toxocara canis]